MAFWSVCKVPKEGDVISGLFHQGIKYRLSEENVAAFPAEQPGLCHHEAELWHTDTEKERESQGSQQNIGFVK